MASTAIRLGKDACMYHNTGSYASPTWDIIDNVRDVTMNLEKAEADASIRGFGGWEAVAFTLKKATFEWQMNHDTADTDWTMIRDAWLNDTAKELLVLDRATGSGAQGLRVTVAFGKFSKGEPLAGVQTTDVMAKPTIAANAPAWYTGA